ncbi:hypothetical protein MCELHM10_01273 [Paracoccaceae bacterium]|jgi:hypothetical protein
MNLTEADPKGLVRESYRIDGITAGECRSIFLDWALSIPNERSVPDAVRVLIATYARLAPDHPMNAVLTEGLAAPATAQRRGGRAGRLGSGD